MADTIIVPERLRLPATSPSPADVVKATNDALREISAAIAKLQTSVAALEKAVQDLQP